MLELASLGTLASPGKLSLIGNLALRAVPIIACGVLAVAVFRELQAREAAARRNQEQARRRRLRIWQPSLN